MSPSYSRKRLSSSARHYLRSQVLAEHMVITAEGERILPCAICKRPIDYTLPPTAQQRGDYYTIDHIDGDPSNNNLSNLQPAHRVCNGYQGGKEGGNGRRKARTNAPAFGSLSPASRGDRARERKIDTHATSQTPFKSDLDSRSHVERSNGLGQKQTTDILYAALALVRKERSVASQRLVKYVMRRAKVGEKKAKEALATLAEDFEDLPDNWLRCDEREDGTSYFSERLPDG